MCLPFVPVEWEERLFCCPERMVCMGKIILAVAATLVLGFCGILLGNASSIPIPELGPVIAVAVMGGFLLYDKRNQQKKS